MTTPTPRQINDAPSIRGATRHNPYSEAKPVIECKMQFSAFKGHEKTINLSKGGDLAVDNESTNGRTTSDTELQVSADRPVVVAVGQVAFDATAQDIVVFFQGLGIALLDSPRPLIQKVNGHRVNRGVWYVTVANMQVCQVAESFHKRAMFHAATIEVWKNEASLQSWIAKRDASVEAKASEKTLLKPMTIAIAKTQVPAYRQNTSIVPATNHDSA